MGCKHSKGILEPPTTTSTTPSKPIKNNTNQITSNKDKLETSSQKDNGHENKVDNGDSDNKPNNQQINLKKQETRTTDESAPNDKSTSPFNREKSLTKIPSNSSHLSASLKISQDSTEIVLDDNILLTNETCDIENVDSSNDDSCSQKVVQYIQEEKKNDENKIEVKQVSHDEQVIHSDDNKDQLKNPIYVPEMMKNTQKNDDTTDPHHEHAIQGDVTKEIECCKSKEEVYGSEKNKDNDSNVFCESGQDKNNSQQHTDVPGSEEENIISTSTKHDAPIKMESVHKLGTMSLEQKMKSLFCKSRNFNYNNESEKNDHSYRPPLSPSPTKIKKSHVDYMEPTPISGKTLSTEETANALLTQSQKMSDQNAILAVSPMTSHGRSSRTSSPSMRSKGTKKKIPDSPYRIRRKKIQEEMQKENPMETQMMNLIQNIEREHSENYLQRLAHETGTEDDEKIRTKNSYFDNVSLTSSLTKLGRQSNSHLGRHRDSEQDETKAILMAHRLQYLQGK